LQEEVWNLRPLTNQVRQPEDRNARLAGLLPGADEDASAGTAMDQLILLRRQLAATESASTHALAEAVTARAATNGMASHIHVELPVKTYGVHRQKTFAPG
jgi:hypothetical protein